jgi:hypothetical protein
MVGCCVRVALAPGAGCLAGPCPGHALGSFGPTVGSARDDGGGTCVFLPLTHARTFALLSANPRIVLNSGTKSPVRFAAELGSSRVCAENGQTATWAAARATRAATCGVEDAVAVALPCRCWSRSGNELVRSSTVPGAHATSTSAPHLPVHYCWELLSAARSEAGF